MGNASLLRRRGAALRATMTQLKLLFGAAKASRMVEAFPSLLQKPAGALAHTHAALVEVLGREGMAKAVAASPFVLCVRAPSFGRLSPPWALVGSQCTCWKGRVVSRFRRFRSERNATALRVAATCQPPLLPRRGTTLTRRNVHLRSDAMLYCSCAL